MGHSGSHSLHTPSTGIVAVLVPLRSPGQDESPRLRLQGVVYYPPFPYLPPLSYHHTSGRMDEPSHTAPKRSGCHAHGSFLFVIPPSYIIIFLFLRIQVHLVIVISLWSLTSRTYALVSPPFSLFFFCSFRETLFFFLVFSHSIYLSIPNVYSQYPIARTYTCGSSHISPTL